MAARALRAARGLLAAPLYYHLAKLSGLPGLDFQASCSGLGVRALLRVPPRLGANRLYHAIRGTLDATRYLEFGFAWRHVAERSRLGAYLDVSSPRLFPLILLHRKQAERAYLLNPDGADLDETARLARAFGLESRYKPIRSTLGGANLPAAAFDLISSISVLEHIRDDSAAAGQIWRLVRPGGLLVLSLPCAAEAAEEFRDVDLYGLQGGGSGWHFFQTIYDSRLLAERILSVLGEPKDVAVYGEAAAGSYREGLQRKLSDPSYPHWREPYSIARGWRPYPRIDDLPGEGVVALAFEKGAHNA